MASDDSTPQSMQPAASPAQTLPSDREPAASTEPAAVPPAGAPPAVAPPPQHAKIRIGSQRWSQKDPKAKPKPATTWRPSPVAAPAVPISGHESPPPGGAAAAAAKASLPAAGESPVAGVGEAAPPALLVEPATAVHAPANVPSGNRGPVPFAVVDSSGPTSANPLEPAAKSQTHPANQGPVQRTAPAPPVVLPNLRSPLTPDLEQELVAALGDLSLDEMLASTGPAAAAPELETESRARGRVVSIHRDNVFLDLGSQRQGVLALRVFLEPPEVGAQLDVQIARFDPAEGLYELVLPGGAVAVEDWSQVTEGMVVEARITSQNKGGLECEVNHLRGFIPASQCSLYRVEDLGQFVGQKLRAVVTEVNPDKHKLVLSPRAVLERDKAEAKTKLMEELEVGQTREGVVRSLQEFGAFVDLGGVDGLVHISQLSWDRVRHASDVLHLGQKIKVRVQKIDPATGKISLAFRDLADNPWAHAASKYPPRSTVQGAVTRLMDFGAFVRLESGIEGLIHISELSHRRVFRAGDILQEGQQVEVLVLSVDATQQRISLSLKALEARPSTAAKSEEEAEEVETPAPRRQHQGSLKGGIGGNSGGDRFGLKW